MDGTIGEIRMFGGTFAPQNWAFCNGQSLPVSTYTALFSLISTIYGGDGNESFNLPNLNNRVPIGAGQSPGLSMFVIGQMGGTSQITLTPNNIAAHSHPLTGTVQGVLISGEDGHNVTPVGNYPAVSGDTIYATTSDGTTMAGANISLVGNPAGSPNLQPIDNMKPYIAMNYIICLEGIYPSRN
jgi:microcystin-dependent protein